MGADYECTSYLLDVQYRNSGNLSARAQLHRDYSTNKHGWYRWVLDQVPQRETMKVLEIGSGSGAFWEANAASIPAGWDVTLTDFSEGMLKETEARLEPLGKRFHFRLADAQDIPFADNSFDLVIANHMLYHVPNRARAFEEIRRVLTLEGCFIASTNGHANLGELDTLLENKLEGFKRDRMSKTFGLETGLDQLRPFFQNVEILLYPDSIEATESGPVMDYILSTSASDILNEEKLSVLRSAIDTEIAAHGAFRITKSVGLFRCAA